MKKVLVLLLSSLTSISYANNLDDWTNEDLCRWMDSVSIPKPISEEIYTRQLSCYISCYNGELTAQIPYCNENSNVSPILPGFNLPVRGGENRKQFPTSPVFNGLDMSGFNPPKVGSMDSRIYYINGTMQRGGSTYISALRSYLESTGQGDAFSENPPGIQPPIPVKFNFEITL